MGLVNSLNMLRSWKINEKLAFSFLMPLIWQMRSKVRGLLMQPPKPYKVSVGKMMVPPSAKHSRIILT